jgi:MYXO-CTERM domain-containing protein
MATEGLLTSADVVAFSEMQSTPVVLGWSCNLARFDIPGFFLLGERRVTEGSSAGVFSATGLSNHVDTDAFLTAFAEAAIASDAETIGDAMIRAHQAARAAPVALHWVYLLLGDPALRLRAAKTPPEPEPDADPEIKPPPSTSPGEPGGPPQAEVDSTGFGSGCEIAPSGSGQGPLGLALLVFSVVLAIRRRRADLGRHRDLH